MASVSDQRRALNAVPSEIARSGSEVIGSGVYTTINVGVGGGWLKAELVLVPDLRVRVILGRLRFSSVLAEPGGWMGKGLREWVSG